MKVSLEFSVKADVADSLENQMEKPSREDLAREGAEEADELLIPRDPDQGRDCSISRVVVKRKL